MLTLLAAWIIVSALVPLLVMTDTRVGYLAAEAIVASLKAVALYLAALIIGPVVLAFELLHAVFQFVRPARSEVGR